jgi:hypothetical protein
MAGLQNFIKFNAIARNSTMENIQIGLVVRISASHSVRDSSADGRGSIPRFGVLVSINLLCLSSLYRGSSALSVC